MVFRYIRVVLFERVGGDAAACVFSALVNDRGCLEFLNGVGRREDGVQVRGDLLHRHGFLPVNRDDEPFGWEARRCWTGVGKGCRCFG